MLTRPTPPKSPKAADIIVGGRVRLRRAQLRLSQEKLADRLGITFQQVQKYEKGINRISASTLVMIASALAVPVAFFFEPLESGAPAESPRGFGAEALRAATIVDKLPLHRRVLALRLLHAVDHPSAGPEGV